MVLNKYRSRAERILVPVARIFSGLHPNTLSAASVMFALMACIAFMYPDNSKIEDIFFPGHYIYIMFAIASICIFLNGFLDAVDGQVARMTNRISKRGDLLDHVLDRYSDIFILGGIMLSPFCDWFIGALAIIAVLMVSYMGTQAQALGCGRDYTGLLGRADRLVILIITPLIQMWVVYYYPSGKLPVWGVESFTIIEWVMIWFIIAGNITAIHRCIQSWHELRRMEAPKIVQKKLDEYFRAPTTTTRAPPTTLTARAANPGRSRVPTGRLRRATPTRIRSGKLTDRRREPAPTRSKSKITPAPTKTKIRQKLPPAAIKGKTRPEKPKPKREIRPKKSKKTTKLTKTTEPKRKPEQTSPKKKDKARSKTKETKQEKPRGKLKLKEDKKTTKTKKQTKPQKKTKQTTQKSTSGKKGDAKAKGKGKGAKKGGGGTKTKLKLRQKNVK
jgi:phosphatidylglycerophosphate synthase